MVELYTKIVFENYANFKGRASRIEYLSFIITGFIILILSMLLGVVIGGVFDDPLGGIVIGYGLFTIYVIFTFLPGLGLTVRRLHDIGKSGHYLIIPIYILILACANGQKGSNQYGDDPKNQLEDLGQIDEGFN